MDGFRRLVTLVVRSLITALLAGAFVGSCGLLAWHAYASPQFEYHVAGELLLVAVLSLEGIVAVRHLRQGRLDSVHQVLIASRLDYRSAEMMLALVTLWKFRHEHGDQFVKVYLDRWREDEKRIINLSPSEQVDALRGSLHYHRRIVKEFYNTIAGLYDLGVLPRELLCTYWSAAELLIIPEILIPLETAVASELRTEKELGGWLERLRRLYDDGRA